MQAWVCSVICGKSGGGAAFCSDVVEFVVVEVVVFNDVR